MDEDKGGGWGWSTTAEERVNGVRATGGSAKLSAK